MLIQLNGMLCPTMSYDENGPFIVFAHVGESYGSKANIIRRKEAEED